MQIKGDYGESNSWTTILKGRLTCFLHKACPQEMALPRW